MFIKKALLPALCALTVIGAAGCNTIPSPNPSPTPTPDTNVPLTVFSCTTDSNKVISVKQLNGNFIYSYGLVSKPAELELTRASNEVMRTPWNGVGSTKSQSIGFTNGSTTYSVYSAYERKAEGRSAGGVLVEQSGKSKKVDVRCSADSMVDNIDSFVQ